MAWQGDERKTGEQCIWEWLGGDFLLFPSLGLGVESRGWDERGEATRHGLACTHGAGRGGPDRYC
jgi:hypothetical protein